MSKVVIISTVNLKHMTGAAYYFNCLSKKKIDYDIICVDKYKDEENLPVGCNNIYKYNLDFSKSTKKYTKLIRFLLYRNFVNNIMKENDYDKIIIWGLETSILLTNIVKSNYILNIRDYANADKFYFKKIVDFKIRQSEFTTISSKGFKVFLPNYEYIIMNSYDENYSSMKHGDESEIKRNPIKIGFIGSVRFLDNDKKLLNVFKNDARFVIQYFGVGSNLLREYAVKNNIYNTEFHESFKPIDTPYFINRIDIINNLYGVNSKSLSTATSLKYFYSIYFNKPILVFKNTFMEKLTDGISYAVENEIPLDLPDRIFEWYNGIDHEEFVNKIEEKKKIVEKENESLDYAFSNFLNRKDRNVK